MPDTGNVMFSRVRLARNYRDIPFNTGENREMAEQVISRTLNAMAMSDMRDRFDFLRIRELPEPQRRYYEEANRVTKDLLAHPESGAALVDYAENVSILMNEEDHLRILSVMPGMQLMDAADRCFRADDILSMHTEIAFDDQLGYLTACPTNAGTGLRASLTMHLPMIALYKQMGNVSQTVAKLGLRIRGVYGEGSEALGAMYQISNQATLGRTEEEILHTVLTVGHQLTDMEGKLREKSLDGNRIQIEDAVQRAVGILTHARILKMDEFYKYWSNLRLGIACGMIPLHTDEVDRMLIQVQDAHLESCVQREISENEKNVLRARRVRELMHFAP
ncbi:MAG: ATP--guanido phosphotransferase [Clostridia bacterium]|nr:ATP--guanido phosphotransferase [Clostridia bacterium]